MIAKLKGRIDAAGADWLVIDVNGVGYHVSCSARTLGALPGPGEFAEIHTEMLVSQDMIRLVGFATVNEREWFRLLQSVQGVGTKDKSRLFVKGKFGHTCGRSDEAEALCIAFWLSTRYSWPMQVTERNDGKDGTRRAMAAALARKCPGPEVLTMFEDMEKAKHERRNR